MAHGHLEDALGVLVIEDDGDVGALERGRGVLRLRLGLIALLVLGELPLQLLTLSPFLNESSGGDLVDALSRRRRGFRRLLSLGGFCLALGCEPPVFVTGLSGSRHGLQGSLFGFRFGHGGLLGLVALQDVIEVHVALCSRPHRRRIPNARSPRRQVPAFSDGWQSSARDPAAVFCRRA
jgi:hypothetical protein